MILALCLLSLRMSYASRITIKETAEELEFAYQKIRDQRIKLKVKSLILFKEGNFKKQEDLANHLCIGYSTLRLWLRKYSTSGFEAFICEPARGKPRCTITPEVHKALEQKLNDSHDALKGYWHAVIWVKETVGVEVGYQALRKYMIKHFKTKLKAPRKSHYKKEAQAIEAFFKTTGCIGGD